MYCKIKMKTKLRSTTDTEAILIVESPQLIVNMCTRMSHREHPRRQWNNDVAQPLASL